MASHPHLPALVPGGALSPDGSTWRSPHDQGWLVPVRARAPSFRGTVKAALTQAGLVDHVRPQGWQTAWVGHGEPAGPGHAVLPDLAPSLRRMAITNNRLATLEDGHVTFRFQEHGRHGWTHRTLPAEACSRRCLHPVRPKGVRKVRDYGFLSPHGRQARDQSGTLLQACPTNARATKSGEDQAPQDTAPAPAEALHGRTCGGPLTLLVRLSPNTRGPPA